MSARAPSPDTPGLRKARGAFFTPPAIAEYLAAWAVENDPHATIMDPTCGEAVFLEAAGRKLRELGATQADTRAQLLGVDLHKASVEQSERILESQGLGGSFIVDDFFALSPPGRLDCQLPEVDAVIGNPPYVRYQQHRGKDRARSVQAAADQGVRLSGLASSWAALLVHACAFLKPEGRLAMVLPAEMLSVGYAEPVRRWLKQRFKAVHLVMFEQLQFSDALENVVLLLARGSGGCNAFSLVPVASSEDLPRIRIFGPMHLSVAPADSGKWTDFLLPVEQRQLFDRVTKESFQTLDKYGSPQLGTVTGANRYFCISDETRLSYRIPLEHLAKISPPGTKHLLSSTFTMAQWEKCRKAGERVWLVYPHPSRAVLPSDPGLLEYLQQGVDDGVPDAYKCRIRTPWYRPPMVPPPDLFFTYMSHRYPRLVTNSAGVSFVNSMHGIRLDPASPRVAKAALPLLALNSATMLGAEILGRSYGGGVLKMEPREAAILPVPGPAALSDAWRKLQFERTALDRRLRAGQWSHVVDRVDEAVLLGACGLSGDEARRLRQAARFLRERRIGREDLTSVPPS